MLKKIQSDQRAFTLIELLVSIAIFTIITTIGTNMIITAKKSIKFSEEQENATENARKAMNIMSQELKEARHSEGTDIAIKAMDDQNLVFYADNDNDGEAEKIQYTVSDYDLIKIVTEPGPAKDYTGSISSSTLSHYVNNLSDPVFYYYDAYMSTATQPYDVRLIRAKLKINVTPSIMPNDYLLTMDVNLRNLKDAY